MNRASSHLQFAVQCVRLRMRRAASLPPEYARLRPMRAAAYSNALGASHNIYTYGLNEFSRTIDLLMFESKGYQL